MQVDLGDGYRLTNDHSSSSYGIPVLITPEGVACGPADQVVDPNLKCYSAATIVQQWSQPPRPRQELTFAALFLAQWPEGPQITI